MFCDGNGEMRCRVHPIEKKKNRKDIKLNQISHKFYAVLIITAILLPVLSFTMVAAEEQAYQDISIDIAFDMIEDKKIFPNICKCKKDSCYNGSKNTINFTNHYKKDEDISHPI